MGLDFQRCTRCIMDTTDPEILFDKNGVCNHCSQYDEISKKYASKEEKKSKLEQLIKKIKDNGRTSEYDCIIGVSGGVDSTFVAYMVKKLGLRPLAVHLDNGWNSELAVANIEKTLKKLEIDLFTYVLDWSEFKDLQLSFLKASVPDLEIPTDHAIFALLQQVADKKGIKNIILGTNYATEATLPRAWSQGHYDWKYISYLQKRFGTVRLKNFPHRNIFTQMLRYKLIKRLVNISILDHIDYVKEDALNILKEELNWQYYGGKHYESIYTRFIQGYILPVKFGFDKRKAHLSTLICSGQITREAALEEMKKPPYTDDSLLQEDKEFVIKKLGITEVQFNDLLKLPNKSFLDYPSYQKTLWYKIIKFGYRLVKKIQG